MDKSHHFPPMLRMSARRRKGAPMPVSAAGLLRFFEEESKGMKVRPEIVLILAVMMIVLTILMNKFFL